MEEPVNRTAMPGQTVEFHGHLIDSLTLSKVTDLIQLMGGHYRLNDIRIGTLKKDISSVNLTVFAENEDKLKELLATLAYYGAAPSGGVSAETVPCERDGALPADAFAIKLPGRVHYQGQWLDLQAGPCRDSLSAGQSLAIVIDPDTMTARLAPADELRAGDCVISGTQGIEW